MTAGSAPGTLAAPDLRRLSLPHLVTAALVPIVLLAALGFVMVGRLPVSSPAVVGSAAPDFSLADLDGNPLRLADLRGRPVILYFWASWCGPCVEEFPLLREASARHEQHGLAVVGIVVDDRSEAARDFMARNGATWPAAMDPGGRVAAAYGILGPPQTYFIGADGTIAARHFGQMTADAMDRQLATILHDHEE